MELNDFLQQGRKEDTPYSLNDLYGVNAGASVSNPAPPKSAAHRSAKAAVLDSKPESLVETYRQAVLEHGTDGKSQTVDSIFNRLIATEKEKNTQAVMGILADPSVSDADKLAAVNTVKDTKGPLYEPSRQIVLKSTTTYNPYESPYNAAVRNTAAELTAPVEKYLEEKQKLYNTHAMQLDPLSSSTFVDMLRYYLLPFANNVKTAKVFSAFTEAIGKKGGTIGAFLLPGNAKKDIQDTLMNIPVEKRLDFDKQLVEIFKNENGLYLGNENQFAAYDWLATGQDTYSDTHKWLDNATTLLDALPMVKGIRKGVSALSKSEANMLRNVERTHVVDPVQPASVGRAYQATNPESTRGVIGLVVKSGDDEASNAFFGTTRSQALHAETAEQIASVDGSIVAKVPDPLRAVNKEIVPNQKVFEAATDNGAIYLTDSEKLQAMSKAREDLLNNEELVLHHNSMQVGVDGSDITRKAVFGTNEGGWLTSEEALSRTQSAFRDMGIHEKEITLLKKVDGEYVPVDPASVRGIEGDYKTAIDTRNPISIEDISNLDSLDVRYNLFDRIPIFQSSKAGSLQRHLLDAHSMLHPVITLGANVAIDKAARLDKVLLDMAGEFGDIVSGLRNERKAKVMEHLKWSNYYGIELNNVDLVGKGFTHNEITAINKFRSFQDNMFWLSNRSAGRRLTIQGYKSFDHPNIKVFVKEIPKNGNLKDVYDPAADMVTTLSKTDMDNLYASGGTYARLRNPVTINGSTVSHMIVRNSGNEIAKTIRDFDQVLNYRQGYYHTAYRTPKYVIEKFTDPSTGATYDRAIGVAANTQDANIVLNDAARQAGKKAEDFGYVRDDIKDLYQDTHDAFFDLAHYSGRTEQKHRGAPLVPFNTLVDKGSDRFILDPIESSIRQARSLSAHVATGEYLETTKARALRQYSDVFPKHPVTGEAVWPKSADDIKGTTRYSKQVADAKTTWGYINNLENGYINAIDETFKQTFNMMANVLSGVSKKGEEAMLWLGTKKPMQAMKSTSFMAYLAANPLRQFFLQPHQSLRLLALDWNYRTFMKTFDDMAAVISAKVKNPATLTQYEKDLVDFLEGSGQVAGVDRNNLVRGSLDSLRDSHSVLGTAVKKPLEAARKVGFDAGEAINVMSSLLYHRNLALKEGKNLADKSVRDMVYGKARNFTYNMNVAGDMPYNQNAFAMVMQFLQVPHKAITQVATNRVIPLEKRIQLFAYDMAMYGTLGTTLYTWFSDILPEDPRYKSMIVQGLEAHALNTGVKMLGSDNKLDFSSLDPYDMRGIHDSVVAMVTGGFGGYLSSPSTQLFLTKNGQEGKIPFAFRKLGEYFGAVDETGDPETAVSVAKAFANISSGMSNLMKAKYIYEQHKTQTGWNAGNVEAIAQAFGFSTLNEALSYKIQQEISQGTKQHEEDIKTLYNIWKKDMLSHDYNSQDIDWAVKGSSQALKILRNDPEGTRVFMNLLTRDIGDPKDKLIANAIKYSGLPDLKEVRQQILKMDLPPEEEWKRQTILDTFDMRTKLKEED